MNSSASRLIPEDTVSRAVPARCSFLGVVREQQMKPQACKSCDATNEFELRRRLLGNGAVQIVFQCLTCGRSATNPISHSKVRNPDQLPPWDESLAERYDNLKHMEYLQSKTGWLQEHDAYLRTQKWRQKRLKVMQRCAGVCEGCMDAKVQHVHHLTYAHWQDELLFELVGLCEPCHERAHKSRDDGKVVQA